MNRRGFLGFLGAGAVAGPAAAKNALTNVRPIVGQSIMADLPGTLGYPNGGLATSSGLLGQMDRLMKLQRLLAGEEEPAEDIYSVGYQKKIRAEASIDALGSISRTAKLRLVVRANEAIEREIHNKSWLRELMELKGKS